MIFEHIEAPLELAAQIIDIIGIAILMIAAVRFLVRYVMLEVARVRGLDCVYRIRDLRLQLGSYILLALEFMIVSDVIHSALSRTMEEFLMLGLLVLIRTALSFFLGLELKEARGE